MPIQKSKVMGRSSKDKRDIYYKQAKLDGYRARSAYKLLQVDEQFGLIGSASRILDLCAAPGSWSQVLSQRVATTDSDSSVVVAVDLQEMAPIANVQIIQGDITSRATIEQIFERFRGQKADLIVCDGAPDVTGMHDLDEYVQAQLLLSALNICTFLLQEKKGAFCAKIFRGPNCELLYTKLDVFFEQVVVTKPKSSRNSSIEAFVVCKGFRLPKNYVPRLFNAFNYAEMTDALPDDEINHANKRLIPFIACGDFSAFDSDKNYKNFNTYKRFDEANPGFFSNMLKK